MTKLTIDRKPGIAYFRCINHQLCLFAKKFSFCLLPLSLLQAVNKKRSPLFPEKNR